MNKTWKEKWNDFRHSRQFRYGSVAVIFTAVVIALVLVLNIAFYALANHFNWYADMTNENLYGVSEASITAIESKGTTDRYEILFCGDADVVASAAGGLGAYVMECAKQYERADNVSIRHLDTANPDATDPTSVAYYSVDGGRTQPSTNSVIIAAFEAGNTAPDAKPSSFRILSLYSFFASDSETGEIFAFDGEYKFTVTMLGLTGQKPVVYFTDGHGENNSESALLYQLFEDAGYQVRVIDLATQSFPAELAIGEIVLVINNPQKDFGAFKDPREDADGDEVAKLDSFLASGGNLLLFADPVRYQLPNLQESIALRGIEFLTDGYVTDTSSSLNGAVAGQTLIAQYPTNTNNASASIVASISSLKTIVPNAVALQNKGPASNSTGEDSDDYQNNLSGEYTTWSPILVSSQNATVNQAKQAYTLMVMGMTPRYSSSEGDGLSGADQNAFSLICGSPELVGDAYLGSTAYANRDLLYGILLSISSQNGSLDLLPSEISMKTLSSEVLTISTRQANVWTVVCTALLPLAATVCGTVVYVRRKHL